MREIWVGIGSGNEGNRTKIEKMKRKFIKSDLILSLKF